MPVTHRKVPLAERQPYARPSAAPQRRALLSSTELLFLSIFPATLILGSLFSQLSPTTRHAPYSADLQAHPAASAPSYFARKDNFLNRYFVKIGWFWITLAFSAFLTSRLVIRRASSLTPVRAVQAALRFSLLTAWWFVATQKSPLGGPPLIDRGFRWTGGRCMAVFAEGKGPGMQDDLETLVTAAACRAVGGAWRGGHDISGHAFLLILGIGLLGFEVLPGLIRRKAGTSEVDAPVMFAAGVAGVAWWMLLMTAAYFHTWFEKLTGLTTALLGLGAVYILPRLVPALEQVLGAPTLD